MPSKPRTPINYEATTGRVFRPASEVQAERDVLERGEMEPPLDEPDDGDQTVQNEQTNGLTNERSERAPGHPPLVRYLSRPTDAAGGDPNASLP